MIDCLSFNLFFSCVQKSYFYKVIYCSLVVQVKCLKSTIFSLQFRGQRLFLMFFQAKNSMDSSCVKYYPHTSQLLALTLFRLCLFMSFLNFKLFSQLHRSKVIFSLINDFLNQKFNFNKLVLFSLFAKCYHQTS